MKAISISKDKYEAEEERLAKLEQHKPSDDTERAIESSLATVKEKKKSKTKQRSHQISDGDENLLMASVSVRYTIRCSKVKV